VTCSATTAATSVMHGHQLRGELGDVQGAGLGRWQVAPAGAL
jgi:hypothetical protein